MSPLPYPSDLNAPGAIEQLLGWHRQFAGDLRMEDEPEPKPDDPKPDPEPTPDPGPPVDVKDPRVVEHINRILSERLAAEKKKHDQALADERAKAGKTAEEKAELERAQAERDSKEKITAAQTRAVQAEAKGIARDLGARPDRLAAILKQADLSKAATDDGDVDEAAVKTAVEAVLKDYPEWKADTTKKPSSTRSGGDLGAGGAGDKPSFTRKEIEDMSSEERVRRIDEINAALADGRVTG